ncbi:MAG: preprotein translocase subunit SecG [Lachnospiraceae bacterium]|nr:preprotein translocase subunit SecG [Lachnospiraceae bacterium]
MDVLIAVLKILLVLVCVGMITIILMQEGKNAGLGQAIAGGSSDSYISKNYGRTPEGKKKTYTKILAVAFMVLALAINILERVNTAA